MAISQTSIFQGGNNMSFAEKVYEYDDNDSNAKKLSYSQVCMVLEKIKTYYCDNDEGIIDSFLNRSVDLDQIVEITELLLLYGSTIPLETYASACCYAVRNSEYYRMQRMIAPIYWLHGIRG